MAIAASQKLPLGAPLPQFSLPNTIDGATLTQNDFHGHPVLVMFICNHCPYVVHLRGALATLGYEYASKDIQIIAISSNDAQRYPADGPEAMKAEAMHGDRKVRSSRRC